LDGIIVYNEKGDSSSGAYTQVFRNGVIESVSTSLLKPDSEGSYIPSLVFERDIIAAFETCISFYKKHSISMPAVLIISLVGVRGYKLAVSQRLDMWHDHVNKIDRDLLLLPEVIVDGYEVNSASILKPIFDAVWNSAGWDKSYGYDEAGEWGKGPNFRR
jgi:hypothetical protein